MLIFIFIYLFLLERERTCASRVGKQERIFSRLHAQHGAQSRFQSHDLEIITWTKTKSQMLNQLRHPSAPIYSSLKQNTSVCAYMLWIQCWHKAFSDFLKLPCFLYFLKNLPLLLWHKILLINITSITL